MYDQGIYEIRQSGEDPDISPELAYVEAFRGNTATARRILQRLLAISQKEPIAPHHFALLYAGLGKTDEAITELEKAYRQHSPMMFWLKVDPRFDRLRPDPRFQELMRRVGLL
jgi:tetratricopeptide (TPR) repeat protein